MWRSCRVARDEQLRLNYRSIAERARRLASSLSRLEFGPEMMAGSLAWNSHRHFELFYGVSGVGAVLHTANPRLPAAQICYTINFTGYRTLFIDLDALPLVESLATRLREVRRYVMLAPRDAMPTTTLSNVICYEDLIDSGDPDFTWPIFDERGACLLCFTSGTTGDPKGALYSHRGTVLSAMSTGAGNGWGLSADDAIIAIPGFFHCNGWAVPFFGPMYGAKLVLPGRRADTEWYAPADCRRRHHGGTGRADDMVVDAGILPRKRALSLGRLNRIYSGGTAPPAAMIEAYFQEFGIRTIHGWGMTETTSGSTIRSRRARLAGTRRVARQCGRPGRSHCTATKFALSTILTSRCRVTVKPRDICRHAEPGSPAGISVVTMPMRSPVTAGCAPATWRRSIPTIPCTLSIAPRMS